MLDCRKWSQNNVKTALKLVFWPDVSHLEESVGIEWNTT